MKDILKTEKMYQFYICYIEDLNKQMLPYPKKKRHELIKEVQSYIYEELMNQKNRGEEFNTLRAINKLYGLVPLTSQLELVDNKRSLHRYFLVVGKYLTWSCLIISFLLVLLKFIYPVQTGLFYDQNQFVGLGYMNFSTNNLDDKLGLWFYLLGILSCLFFMFLHYLLTIRMYSYPSEYNNLILELLTGVH